MPSELTKEKRKSPVFVYVICLVLVFIVLALIAMQMLGWNIFTKANNLKKSSTATQVNSETLTKLKADLKNESAQITDLQNQLNQQQDDNTKLQGANQKLQDQLDKTKSTSSKNVSADTSASSASLSDIYASMSAKNAAPILLQLKDNEAVAILKSLDADLQASILSKMPVTDAAKYTQLLKK